MKPFHDKMHVRLRNGIEIKGLSLGANGEPSLGANTARIWNKYGKWLMGVDHPTDIVEVLSDGPRRYLRDMKLEDLKEGMEFMPEEPRAGDVCCYSVKALTNGSLVMQSMYTVGQSHLAFIDEDLLKALSSLGLYLDGGE